MSFRCNIALLIAVSACSTGAVDDPRSSDSGTTNADAGVDAGEPIDAGEPVDAGEVDAGPVNTCGVLPANFACEAFDAAKDLVDGATTCDSTKIDEFVTACFGPVTNEDLCVQWLSTFGTELGNTPCGQCLNRWIDDVGNVKIRACHYRVVGGSDVAAQTKCRDAVKCMDGCLVKACKERCEESAVQGCATEAVGEFGACTAFPPGETGVATVATACLTNSGVLDKMRRCTPQTPAAMKVFFRGACRDNADWTNALTP